MNDTNQLNPVHPLPLQPDLYDVIMAWELDSSIGMAVKRLFTLNSPTNGTAPINQALDAIDLIHQWVDARSKTPPAASPLIEYSTPAHKVEVAQVCVLPPQEPMPGPVPIEKATIERVVENHQASVTAAVDPLTAQPTCIRYGCDELKKLTSEFCEAHYDETCRGGGCGE